MPDTTSYLSRRGELETYFDRTASDAWAKLTSDAPVSKIRATVRAGRDSVRQQLLDWLPADLTGATLLDAGCGPGQFAVEAAKRGAKVTAVDLSPTLLKLAEQRINHDQLAGSIEFIAGDMLDPAHGHFDYTVAMDSLIHYRADDMVRSLNGLTSRTSSGVLFTFAPRTPLLSVMHAVGKLFPKSDKAPAIQPVSSTGLKKRIAKSEGLQQWSCSRARRISSTFYISEVMELAPK